MNKVSVHMNQAAFVSNLVRRFVMHTKHPSPTPTPTPTGTPYRSVIHINSIPDATVDDNSPVQTRYIEAYQSLVGSLGWLANNTRLDISTVHFFLFSYTHIPSLDHIKAALYALYYVHLMHNYGISFSSTCQQHIHTFVHFRDASDIEAYTDTLPPNINHNHHLTAQINP